MRVRTLLDELVRDDAGQDLVEYALLVMFFGLGLVAVWSSIVAALQASYGGTNAGMDGLWDPPDPGGTPP
jgi:Flp pilus assembly pilin Flp